MKRLFILIYLIVMLAVSAAAQKLHSPKIDSYVLPDDLHIQIVKAEDSRDPAPVVAMLTNVNSAIRYRAALAAGRIGDDKALPGLTALLSDSVVEVRAMAAFAIGEVESAKGADAILKVLNDPAAPHQVRARAVEAAGKIAAANPRDAKTKDLGDAIVNTLRTEDVRGEKQDHDVVLMAITAALRARPAGADAAVAKFLTSTNARIRGDAGNTLSRLRAKNANAELRSMLRRDPDVNARANAARALGAAEDKEAYDLLLDAAVNGDDQRVRVSAIRSLGSLKEDKALEPLVEHGNKLIEQAKKTRSANPSEKTELLEIAAVVGRLVPNSYNDKAVDFLQALRKLDRFRSGETETALATVAPSGYVGEFNLDNNGYSDWRVADAYADGLGVIAASTDAKLKLKGAEALTKFIAGMATGVKPRYQSEMLKAIPGLQRTNAAFKPDNLNDILRNMLKNEDVNVRAAAADLIASQPQSKENTDALKSAFSFSFIRDRRSDDALLGIMGALYRLNKKESVGILLTALNSPNYLIRRRAIQQLSDAELQKESPGVPVSLEEARKNGKDKVMPYSPMAGSFLGQVLNKDADYRRALSRKNGSATAVFQTSKGNFSISLNGGDAPLTVDNFIQLARRGYFNGAEVHRVVANFVMQDGDPTGTGSGGPGLSIRCEINMAEFERGSVGMALSGKDTGGSQWFVDHAPQPHLDGGYTVFGKVNETGMKVVDSIVRGDKILRVTIIGR
ncbi:MAG TPA: peptidylprolyl isomerase [Pyrinomonadaceae bacterium]|nr:peptidylprolyl isomerase [Acidobacteriota bacterium]HQZ94818.1 peptidylprolyl isomerase [Pyrinomonadaceae bacterium]